LGKREETPRVILILSRSHFLEESQPQGRFTSRTAGEGTIEYGRQLERDTKEIFFPPEEEEEKAKRHCLEVKRQLDTYQRYSCSLPNNSPHACEESQRTPPERRERTQREILLTRPDRPGNCEDYLEEWYRKAMKMARVCILTPHPEGVKLEALKNGPMQFPDKKWSVSGFSTLT
jgi:hypothetical protein